MGHGALRHCEEGAGALSSVKPAAVGDGAVGLPGCALRNRRVPSESSR